VEEVPRHRKRSKFGRIVDFLFLADVFLFGILLASSGNLRLALIVPLAFDVIVLSLATTRQMRLVIAAVLVPLGIALTLFRVPWGWLIAVAGLVIALGFSGGKKAKEDEAP